MSWSFKAIGRGGVLTPCSYSEMTDTDLRPRREATRFCDKPRRLRASQRLVCIGFGRADNGLWRGLVETNRSSSSGARWVISFLGTLGALGSALSIVGESFGCMNESY